MKDLILRILRESVSEPNKNQVLTRQEISLFKYINKEKGNVKTKQKLLDLFKEMLDYFGMPVGEARKYYEVYLANFRPDGDYENITPEEFIDYREIRPSKITNNSAYEYTAGKLPFKGSNLEGKWSVNQYNESYYVVTSYGWYPIYLFINNQWFRVLDSYSSSTRKHLSHSNPVVWDNGINKNVIVVTKDEMNHLMNGRYNLEIMKSKRVPAFIKDMKTHLIGTKKLISSGWGNDGIRVSYTITDIFESNGKIKIVVKINKAGRKEGRRMVPTTDYQNDEQMINKIEGAIIQNIIKENPKYLSNDNVEIEVIH